MRALLYGFVDVGEVGTEAGYWIDYTSSVGTVLSRKVSVFRGVGEVEGDKDQFFDGFCV